MTTASPSYRDGLAMVRIIQLLEQSRRRAILLDDLAERLEVHRRTARRYVQALEEEATTADGNSEEARELGLILVLPPAQGPYLFQILTSLNLVCFIILYHPYV